MRKLIVCVAALMLVACQGRMGRHGAQGQVGLPGTPGADGASCSIEDVSNGAIITCGSTSVVIFDGANGADGLNGADGQDGADGQNAPPTAYTVTELVDVCGDSPGFDEVLMRLANNQLVAHYAGGGNLQFLTVLSPGTYTTTDQVPCTFTVGPAPGYVVTY